MIYYDIQHHGDTKRLKWLFQLLMTDENIFNFSLDMAPSAVNEFDSWCHSFGSLNVNVSKSLPVTWCGPSKITQMRDMLERAIKVDGWEYFVNLSGSCFPLVSQDEIKRRINKEKYKGKTSFCFGFFPKKKSIWYLNESRETCSEYFEYKYLRLNLSCNETVIRSFRNKTLDPVKNVMQRRALHCSEVVNEKRLILRGLEDWELRERKKFWENTPYFVGRTWMILHRKQVEWLLTTPLMNDLYCQLINTFEPDETLFPSLLYSKLNPYLDELSSDNYRYKLGEPGLIKTENLNVVLESGALFARKLSPEICQSSLEHIESKVNL